MKLFLAAVQAFLLIAFTTASPVAQANPTATHPCPYQIFVNEATRITWTAAPSNTIVYPLSYSAGATPVPSPAECLIAPGAPYCLEVTANLMAASLWKQPNGPAVASVACPVTSASVTALATAAAVAATATA